MIALDDNMEMTPSVRDCIKRRLSEDLIGPKSADESLTSYPTDVYLTGILFPQNSPVAPEEADLLQAEGIVDVNAVGAGGDELSLASVKRPASAGISFVVEPPLSGSIRIAISVTAGKYARESSEGTEPGSWVRKGVTGRNEVEIDDKFLAQDFGPEITGVAGLALHVRTSPWEGRRLVTVAMVNKNNPGKDYEKDVYEEMCFFQTHLTVSSLSGTKFCPRHISASAIDEDTKMSRLIYRDVVEYAVGHTCSALWNEFRGDVTDVETTWIPSSVVRSMSSSGVPEFEVLRELGSGPVLSTHWLSEASGSKLADGLRRLPELYASWLGSQQQKIAELPADLRDQAEKHIGVAGDVGTRMLEAVELIESDPDVESAFRLANRAILLQRKWIKPGDQPLLWYPFQLGFILLSLSSLARDEHPDRRTADLLWFPTGGGKTEAYFGLIAFIIFLRRLRYGDSGAGVASIMRYTLRLLTTQQFQRAAALICACEALRLEEELPNCLTPELGSVPFSLGLWVGGDATPNRLADAQAALADESTPSRPDQLSFCPKHPTERLIWAVDGGMCRANCAVEDCHWHQPGAPLPVWTVDDDVYRVRPSLLIGTVDKFTQVARNPNTASLFGSDGANRQPDLIIQDELHLISGPLGTLAGLYETAIDRLCTRGDVRPKILASTATIRQASEQIRALFDRQTCLFPPPVLDASNSGFAVEDTKAPGRLYIGITTAGRSAKFTLQAASASLLQSAKSNELSDELRDDYWTLVTYFNSLRELGGALVLMQDDVPKSLELYAGRRQEEVRKLSPPVELTSRVSQTEIKEILELLVRTESEEGCCDALLSSNMISVGVDVPRLGVMIVNGQPKGVAEYIQATSRVGRRFDGPGGLVLTAYNNAKARDRSHFETFRTWHAALYREVEATSVTPFAARAREKALHATLVVLARQLLPALRLDARRAPQHLVELQQLADLITERARVIDPDEAANVEDMLLDFVENWEINAPALEGYWNDYKPKKSLLISAEKVAELRSRFGSYRGIARATPNSMRNVEPGTAFKIRERL